MADAYTPPAASSQYPTPRAGLDAVAAQIRGVKRRQDESERSRTLQSAAISSGGLVVKDGGSVTVRDGGGFAIDGGGDLTIGDGGDVVVQDGGGLEVRDGGYLRGKYADGSTSAVLGPIRDAATGAPFGHGLLVQSSGAEGGADIFKAKREVDGARTVEFGSPNLPLDDVWGRTQRWWIRAAQATGTGGDAPMRLTCAGEIGIYSETGRLRVPWTNASAAANVALDADGIVLRVSSALKYKQDLEDYNADPDAVLALRPRTWRDRGEVERDPDTTNRYVGFIAEEVHDAGLTDLVVYDADGNPDALSYDRFSAALLAVIRRQQDQIDSLTRELGELRARLPEETP
ncbi:hypothetical protein JN535_08760 [Cellulosimicrobium cellulans]|uniref:hypothetical protein n=1 Tax=Cellulosimicrobium cellulans TaxID=1710 RepID=UPI001964041F|nr:hypothetical protein [Cellulosimicrobium cellulans]MBN0040253.1 hypothetical protein [Cellulosimicrobium cellulans]